MTIFEELDIRLDKQVRPDNWKNPNPASKYNLVVIGAGTAGLVAAAGAAGLGAKVALIERNRMGGDCLNFGCVPSKALIASARAIARARRADEHSLNTPAVREVDFSKIVLRMRSIRSDLAIHDSAERFRRLGVDVFFGDAKFSGRDAIGVGNWKLRFATAVIATGARAAIPPIPGLNDIEPLTNETVFSLNELPKRLIVLGAGPIGVELAQCFARFGSQVWLVDRASQILPREETDAASLVVQSLMTDGVQVKLNAEVLRCERTPGGKRVVIRSNESESELLGDQVLVATGRTPNVDGMGLELAGVEFDQRAGIHVNDFLRTTNRRIYSSGDCCSDFKFTHAADAMARIVVQNALFLGRARFSRLVIPWTTFSDPEIGHVGIYPDESAARGIKQLSFTQSFEQVDRAVLEGESSGFVRVHVRAGTDRILGATVVSQQASEILGLISFAMRNRIGLGRFASTIFPYPTLSEALRKLGDQYNRTRLTPMVAKLFNRWLAWRR